MKISTKREESEDMAIIEEYLEKGESCASFMHDYIDIPMDRIQRLLAKMARYGILEKTKKVRIGETAHLFYKISTDTPKQVSMIMEPARRDPLVAALFGPK